MVFTMQRRNTYCRAHRKWDWQDTALMLLIRKDCQKLRDRMYNFLNLISKTGSQLPPLDAVQLSLQNACVLCAVLYNHSFTASVVRTYWLSWRRRQTSVSSLGYECEVHEIFPYQIIQTGSAAPSEGFRSCQPVNCFWQSQHEIFMLEDEICMMYEGDCCSFLHKDY